MLTGLWVAWSGRETDEDRYRAAITTLCERREAQLINLGNNSKETFNRLMGQGIEFTEQNIEYLEGLTPPDELRRTHSAAINALAAQAQSFKRYQSERNAGRAGDEAAQTVNEQARVLESALKTASGGNCPLSRG